MRSLTRPVAAAVLSTAWLFVLPMATAVSQPSDRAQDQASPPAIPDAKLDAAAAAMERVGSLQESYQRRVASAPPAEKKRLTGEADTALRKAVTDEGLSVEEYSAILQVAQNDPSVRKRLLERIGSANR
jgi:hypothetical protein